MISGRATAKLLKGVVVPQGVVTVTVRDPRAAPGAIVTANDRYVACTEVITAVRPVPLNVTSVAFERPSP